MSTIKTRIRIEQRKGSDLTLMYNIDNFYAIAKASNKKDGNNVFLSIGNLFNVAGVEYGVVDIQTNVYDASVAPEKHGANLIADSEEAEYNFEVTYIVERV